MAREGPPPALLPQVPARARPSGRLLRPKIEGGDPQAFGQAYPVARSSASFPYHHISQSFNNVTLVLHPAIPAGVGEEGSVNLEPLHRLAERFSPGTPFALAVRALPRVMALHDYVVVAPILVALSSREERPG